LALWFLPVFNEFAVTAALPVAFFSARRCRPITLLGLPSRPSPGFPPALFAAIALARLARAKPMLTAFQQTAAGARTADRPFPPAVFLILLRACRILVRAHGSVAPGKLMPRRGLASSPGRSSSGSVQTQDSIAAEPVPPGRSAVGFPAPAAARLPNEQVCPALLPVDSSVRHIPLRPQQARRSRTHSSDVVRRRPPPSSVWRLALVRPLKWYTR
jgi:hypothetical protein